MNRAEFEAYIQGAPPENYSQGVFQIEIPELGEPTMYGKVRDNWVLDGEHRGLRIIGATDRQSAFNVFTGTTPGKGQILNAFFAVDNLGYVLDCASQPHGLAAGALEGIANDISE